MRLKYQIFLTLVSASALLIAIMFALSSWSFNRGFLDYVNQNEKDRLSPVVDELVDQFEQYGHWDWVNRRSMRELLPEGWSAQQGGRTPGKQNRSSTDVNSSKPPPNSSRRRANRFAPLVLADKDKTIISASAKSSRQTQWIELRSNDQIIGFLGFPQVRRVDRHYDQVFESKQRKNMLWAALAMVLISGLLSIPLAELIVRPLLKVNRAVDEISGGNYAHRVQLSRGDELGDLANNVNMLGLSLEKNRDARQRWIAEISHELRTPVAVMRGELEAMQDGIRSLDRQAIDSLHTEALRLGRLIDDLHTLSMSDVGALNYQMEKTSLKGLLERFLGSAEAILEQHELSLTHDLSPLPMNIQGDVRRLEQLLANLLQNTCRYTNAGGQLEVRLSGEKNNGRQEWVMDWFDSSPGVDPSVISKLFDPLFRTDESRNRELGGSGLGLSIAKSIVDAHQGSIDACESSLGGLHLRISLPASK